MKEKRKKKMQEKRKDEDCGIILVRSNLCSKSISKLVYTSLEYFLSSLHHIFSSHTHTLSLSFSLLSPFFLLKECIEK